MEHSQVNDNNAAVVNDLGCKSLKKGTSEDSGDSGKRKSKLKVGTALLIEQKIRRTRSPTT